MKRNAAKAEPPSSAGDRRALPPGLQRVVVVDDEPDLLFVVQRALAELAPEVEVAAFDDPRAALESIRAAAPDVLVTDLRMPEISGIELIWWARESAPQLPIVVVSAYGTLDIRREIEGRGSMAFVEKPVNGIELIEAMNRATHRSVGAPSDFQGMVHLSGTVDVVQLYALARANGRLTIRRAHDEGEVWFESGEIVHAVCRGTQGEPAVYALLAWSGGEFSFAEFETAPRRSIEATWQHVLLEGCRLMDEERLTATTRLPDDPEAMAEPTVTATLASQKGDTDDMANLKDSLTRLSQIDGYIGSCIVDSNSGMMLGADGGGGVNLEVAAAGNTEVVRAKRKTMSALGLKDAIEDILITLGKQFHLIRPLASKDGLFIYLVLDKSRANLAMGRHQLASVEAELAV